MPGGKRRLTQLFVGRTKIGANGTQLTQILSGSVSVAGPVYAGGASGNSGSAETKALTIANLGANDQIMLAISSGLSACVAFNGEVSAGAGSATMTFRYAGSGASVDPYTCVVRYIAFKLT
ncbi:MAG: hypothetical protein ACW99J_15500 [Candidatus Thorarchaeota archaeon]|jgi:hypothetical protein